MATYCEILTFDSQQMNLLSRAFKYFFAITQLLKLAPQQCSRVADVTLQLLQF
jgi:hypothetical protein